MGNEGLSAKLVREFFYYSPETGELYYKPRDRVHFDSDSRFKAWNTSNAGMPVCSKLRDKYYRCKILGRHVFAHRVAWVHYYGEDPDKKITHNNGDGFDNRISNLSLVEENNHLGSRLTIDRAREMLAYNPESGDVFWKTGRPGIKAGSIAGSFDKDGYRRIRVDGLEYRMHALIWFLVTGNWPECQIDHIDHNPSNNKWENLREVDLVGNARNKSISKNNKSGAVGVQWHKRHKKWIANISDGGRLKHLGYFDEKEEAIKARKRAEREYGYHENHGIFVSSV